MKNEVFISNSINKSIENYIYYKDEKYSKEFNSFLCTVFRMLTLIYDAEELLKTYREKNNEQFDNCLMKYGLEIEKVDEFKINFEKYYKFDLKQQGKVIKKKNKYFNLVQKSLVDMMIKRKSTEQVSKEIIDEFYELLFTANSKDFYRRSIAVLEAYNPYEIEKYAKKYLLGVEV